METKEFITLWRETFFTYLNYCDVPENDWEPNWVAKTQGIMEYWNKMLIGEVPKTYDDFNQLLLVNVTYYANMNEYYQRFGKPGVETKNEGGRRWL